MQAPDGKTMWGKWVFREGQPRAARLRRLVLGRIGRRDPPPFALEWPLETLSTITFAEHDGKTTLTMAASPSTCATAMGRKTFETHHDSMQQGWAGTLDQLAAYLARS